MNDDNHPQDDKWRQLLARSGPTFAAETEPPYGFVTSTLARLRNESREQEVMERIGLRALLASFVILLVTAGFVWMQFQDGLEMEPGVNSLIRAHDFTLG